MFPNQDELEEIEQIFKKWLIPIETKNRKIIYNLNLLHKYFKDADFTSLIKAFTERLKDISCQFTKSEQVSGSICFFGGVFTSLLNYGYIEEIEGLFTFALCYMLVDHFLDDNTISNFEKDKCIKDIYSFITEDKVVSDNKLINAASKRYLELIQRVPRCKEYIIKLFKSEIKGVKIQKNKNLKREDYLNIAEEKGGFTSACIASIIGLDPEGENHKFGSLIQSPCDDLLDVKDDTESDIYTLIRYDIDHGILDRYLYENIKKINELSSTYNFFKIILLTGIILGIHDNPGCISKEFDEIVQKYNPFDKETSKDTLIEWFHEKLYKYIEEN
jgi:hypothetical protein